MHAYVQEFYDELASILCIDDLVAARDTFWRNLCFLLLPVKLPWPDVGSSLALNAVSNELAPHVMEGTGSKPTHARHRAAWHARGRPFVRLRRPALPPGLDSESLDGSVDGASRVCCARGLDPAGEEASSAHASGDARDVQQRASMRRLIFHTRTTV